MEVVKFLHLIRAIDSSYCQIFSARIIPIITERHV